MKRKSIFILNAAVIPVLFSGIFRQSMILDSDIISPAADKPIAEDRDNKLIHISIKEDFKGKKNYDKPKRRRHNSKFKGRRVQRRDNQ